MKELIKIISREEATKLIREGRLRLLVNTQIPVANGHFNIKLKKLVEKHHADFVETDFYLRPESTGKVAKARVHLYQEVY